MGRAPLSPPTAAAPAAGPSRTGALGGAPPVLLVALPFAVALVRVLTTAGAPIHLPDDLALIQLHTRDAMAWRQSLGPFDRYGWSHPGPAYFYLQAVLGWLAGPSATALVVGALAINAASAVVTVRLLSRRVSRSAGLAAAAVLGLLAFQLSFSSPHALTYSEGTQSALVSPWNPTVVVFPLVLALVLAALGAAGSWTAAAGFLVVGSFVVQTDLSAAPLVAVAGVVALAGAIAFRWSGFADRREAGPTPWRQWGLWVLVALLVAEWVPPIVQQAGGHPGNLTLIRRFFTSPPAGAHGQSLGAGLGGAASANGILLSGTDRFMDRILGATLAHPATAVAASAIGLAAGLVACVVAWRRRSRFALALGAASTLGMAAVPVAATRVTGFFFGYLVLWAVAAPVGCLLASTAAFGAPRRDRPEAGGAITAGRGLTRSLVATGVLASAFAVGASVHTATMAGTATLSDPVVGSITRALLTRVPAHEPFFVGDSGSDLIQLEQFIGVVNGLDAAGLHPRVSPMWSVQFGTRLVEPAHRTTPVQVLISAWTPASISLPGYVGRFGKLALAVIRAPAST